MSKTDSSESEQTLPSASSFAGSVESEDTRPITIDDFDLSHIPEPYKSQLADMLMKHVSAFGTSLKDIKSTNVYEHHIELSDTTPSFKNAYRLPFAHRDIVKSEVDKLLASGIIEPARGVRSGSFNISERDDKREQVSTILVNISVNEAVVFTSMFQLLVVLALLGRILGADWSGNDVLLGWELVYHYGKALKSIARGLSRGALLRPAGPYWVPRGPDSSFGTLIR